MAQGYQLIQTQTLSSAASSISFTNIPQNYTDLIIKASLRGSTTTTTFAVQVNGSTVTAVMRLYGTGSAAASDTFNEHYINPSDFTANTFGNTELYFPGYSGSNSKIFLVDSVGENNASTSYLNIATNRTNSTSAITSINLIRTSGNFVQNSTVTLYGIGGSRASGGTITADGNYTYHTFTSSGSFIPAEKIRNAEAIVLAGGGGGGTSYGAGGGAGGLLYTGIQNLNAGTTYSVIVGSGGANGSAGNSSMFLNTIPTGGGVGGSGTGAGGNGGSGGGAGGNGGTTGGTAVSGQGSNGGVGAASGGGGGGGAGAVGGNAAANTGGAGGNGSLTYSSWHYATQTGVNLGGVYYIAGGGGGYGQTTRGMGGLGGGGNGSQITGSLASTNGTANTGGGGGGEPSGAGGSGLVIIRYPNN